ncbi:SDR family NAD(P)-dependent oxidoreductase [Rhodoferax sp.]|uniref:SDR family NAD(P)-dependent oxidoreductase n=1 Tax=Rhodoferax sp. TaxID=50421 RepID=UPI00374D1194
MPTELRPTRRALITGGSSGLGLACARSLLQDPGTQWSLLIASRNAADGQRAADTLNREAGRSAVRYLPLDLGSLQAIHSFADALLARGERLDALVLNAGLQFRDSEQRTADGFEATFGTNHLGHFLLLHRLLPLLQAQARVAVVSSGTHDAAQRTGMPVPRFVGAELLAHPEQDVQRQFAGADAPSVQGRRRYSTSKLCNVYFTYELDRRLRALPPGHALAGVAVNAFDPGLMPGTGLARAYPPALRWVWKNIMPVLRLLVRNANAPETSGAALAALVRGEPLPVSTGAYYEGRKPIRSSTPSYDTVAARALWEASARMVGVDASMAAMAAMR